MWWRLLFLLYPMHLKVPHILFVLHLCFRVTSMSPSLKKKKKKTCSLLTLSRNTTSYPPLLFSFTLSPFTKTSAHKTSFPIKLTRLFIRLKIFTVLSQLQSTELVLMKYLLNGWVEEMKSGAWSRRQAEVQVWFWGYSLPSLLDTNKGKWIGWISYLGNYYDPTL